VSLKKNPIRGKRIEVNEIASECESRKVEAESKKKKESIAALYWIISGPTEETTANNNYGENNEGG